MTTRTQILATLTEILTEQSGDQVTLTEETDIKRLFRNEDASLDSLDLVEMIMEIEDHYRIEIDDNAVESAFTVKDLIDLVVMRIG